MTTHLQKAIEESLKEFDEKLELSQFIDDLKSHLLSSQKKLILALIEDLEEKEELHTHDSIFFSPTYTAELKKSCITCVKNQIIADIIKELKEVGVR